MEEIVMANELNSKSLKYYIETWGCQMNEEDSEKLSGMLKRLGYTRTEEKNEAGIILYNTCCVRENAENKVFGNLGQLKKLKEKNPDLIIGICGCMMQQEGMADKILKQFPYVNIIFGTHNAYKFPEYLNRVRTEGVQIKEIFNKEEEIVEGLPIDRQSDVKAFVTIMYGCNNFCTYCIVPFVRGRERSRKPEDIINEIKELVSTGYKEITLLGQNVNSYGNDDKTQGNFAELLQSICQIEGDFKLTFMTSHPKDCSFELLDTMAACEKVERHIHLPFQSGNNRVLDAMNRRYTRERYKELALYARKIMPDISITSDVIVGFPGETHEEFLDTVSLVKEIGFTSLYIFIYSKREGTKAANMPDPISHEEKSAWFAELQKAQEEVAFNRSQSMKGQVYRVLAEGRNKAGRISGRTSGNIMIEFDGPDECIGTFCNVKVTEPLTWILKGELA